MADIHILPSAAPLPENPLQIVSSAPTDMAAYLCQHDALELDTYERTIACAKCQAKLDPFEYLWKQANHLQYAWIRHAEMLNECKAVTERITAMKKEEGRLRARIKRLQDGNPTVQLRPKDWL